MAKSNLDLLNACDSFPYESISPEIYNTTLSTLYTLLSPTTPHRPIGYLTEPVFNALAKVPIRLKGEMEVDRTSRTVIVFTQPTAAERTAAVKATVDYWREKETFHVLKGWRNELYACYGANNELLWEVERSASMLFGIVTYGVHLTGFVEIDKERMEKEGTKWGVLVWVPRRSATKQTFPGMLDNTVAGGMASGEVPLECVIREAEEEASLPADFVRENVVPKGTLTYIYIREGRAGGEDGLLQPECQYIFDLALPPTLVPTPNDSEVQEFNLLTIEKCQEYMAAGQFKPNCALLMLDFFVRKGVVTEETEGKEGYEELTRRLRRDLGFPGPWEEKEVGK